ncbi:hypothetical protein PHYSODRAFT_338624 [Phytophthora sojae]|uniref:Uncharacterized protein n=1 Tax=Phytophthora sojae (strain P6497) TaxID=1094619 RepID=G5A2M4_PHYSP|nr:hypothetical protein PHYSODRAFT_338624 [Phytophthora sojae]EGZ09914.1 hypothetical protein PHYSODRAFT_338624 [Phytophthora sojae]|eukprot:XP_009534775.1 hypothetical protein PHYSODRAFT_338624 [Phytophthora sojae]
MVRHNAENDPPIRAYDAQEDEDDPKQEQRAAKPPTVAAYPSSQWYAPYRETNPAVRRLAAMGAVDLALGGGARCKTRAQPLVSATGHECAPPKCLDYDAALDTSIIHEDLANGRDISDGYNRPARVDATEEHPTATPPSRSTRSIMFPTGCACVGRA